jgi:small subunit ribosomal protein S14
MKYLLQKDKLRRKIFENFEKERLCLKALSKDKRLSKTLRLTYKLKLNSYPRNSSFTRIVNRCVTTGRGRGVLRFFRMSRLEVRQLQLKGFLYGIRKSSW